MKTPQLFSVLATCVSLLYSSPVTGQLVGTEQVTNKQVYEGVFTVNGDKYTYYPVVFKNGNQNVINHLTIYRSYHEPGPNELHPTHKGALLLEIDVNYGGWGGQSYGWEIAFVGSHFSGVDLMKPNKTYGYCRTKSLLSVRQKNTI